MIEATSVVQPLRLGLHAPRLAFAPRGSGRPVMDLPGWRTSEASMAPLRAYLRGLGHHAVSWGLGTNRGQVRVDVDRVIARLERVAGDSGDTVALVGWSLGGTIAREVARARPDLVRRVITMGSPIVGLPNYTLFSGTDGGLDHDDVHAQQARYEATTPIMVPLTTIFTRRDRIVAWPACIDHHSAEVEHVEVTSPHLGLGLDPDVWRVVADRLAR